MEYIPVTSRTSAPHRVALLSGKGEALERAEALRGLIAPLVDAGQSRRAITAALNAAGHRTVVTRLVGPRVAVISAHPHKQLARDAGEGERLARPRVHEVVEEG